jgi:uridine phosphorylase
LQRKEYSYWLYGGKPLKKNDAICNPSDFIRYVAQNKRTPAETMRAPDRLVITYQRSTYEKASKFINGKCVEWWMYGDAQPFSIGQFDGVDIGLVRLWIGAPATAMTLEEIIACGSRRILEIGLSGGLQPYLQPSDIVVVTEAIRDEGTSRHYLPQRVKVESTIGLRRKLINKLEKEKIKHFVGPVWSTDAVYRETRIKFRKFQNSGVLAVDMETSALFAVAKYRNIEAASTQVISDVLTENGWLQAYEHHTVRKSTDTLLKIAFEVLSRI